jgi:hypothetical protein
MSKIERLIAYALFLIPVFWAPASSLAQSPFDGTWRINMDQTKMSPKPLAFSVNNGMYDCFYCSPQIHVKADQLGCAALHGRETQILVRQTPKAEICSHGSNNS